MMQTNKARIAAVVLGGVCAVGASSMLQAEDAKFPKKTGAQIPDVEHKMTDLTPTATFAVQGHPDWMAVTDDAVWVTSSSANHVVRLDAKTNQPGAIVTIAKPCAGLALGFGSLWIPQLRRSYRGARRSGDRRGSGHYRRGSCRLRGRHCHGCRECVDRDVEGERPGAHRSGDQHGEVTYSDSGGIVQSHFCGRLDLGELECRRNAGARRSGDRQDGERNAGGSYAAISHRGRRGDLGVESRRRHDCSGRYGYGQANSADCGGNSGTRRRDCVRGRGGVGDGLRLSDHADRRGNQSSDRTMARAGRRQHPVCPRDGVADQPDGRQGMAFSCLGRTNGMDSGP